MPDPSAPVPPGLPTPPEVEPLDVDGVGAVLAGTVAWAVALVVCLVLRDRLAADGHTWWTWVCLTGALLGLPGLWYVRRRRDAYAAHRSH